MVDGLRILFGAPSAGYPRTPRGAQFVPYIYKYKLEGSMDGEKWEVILDKSNNTESKNTIFDEVKPSECRYVKFTMIDWPKNSSLGIIDLTVFGKPAASFDRNSTFVTKFPTSAR
ncbi:MAG: discoidin domain-containing protein, partial [Bacteroidales bacterium]|nr:discoidin domain-containing protein [Bacteroidales bacterium]